MISPANANTNPTQRHQVPRILLYSAGDRPGGDAGAPGAVGSGCDRGARGHVPVSRRGRGESRHLDRGDIAPGALTMHPPFDRRSGRLPHPGRPRRRPSPASPPPRPGAPGTAGRALARGLTVISPYASARGRGPLARCLRDLAGECRPQPRRQRDLVRPTVFSVPQTIDLGATLVLSESPARRSSTAPGRGPVDQRSG